MDAVDVIGVYDFWLKLVVAMVLGLFIGIDREIKHKPLGVKTSIVIAVASCLVTIVSIQSVGKFALPGSTNVDPMRLAAQIVSGVGFIGAGVILKRGNDVISGLTTAAMVWAASGLGIAAGGGYYTEAFTAVLLIIASVNLFPYLIKGWGPESLNRRDFNVRLVLERNNELTSILEEISNSEFMIKHVKIKDLPEEKQQIQFIATTPEQKRTTEVYYDMSRVNHVIFVEVENK